MERDDDTSNDPTTGVGGTAPARPTAADLRALPKALLHEHLDGSLRPATLLALARARGLPLPVDDPDGLGLRVADALRDQGAIPLLERVRPT